MGFKPDLNDQLVSFIAWSLLVWSSGLIWPVKIVSDMTYYVSSGTLNPTHSVQCNARHWTDTKSLESAV